MPAAAEVTDALDHAYREEWAKVLATLTRHVDGDLGLRRAGDVAGARRPPTGLPSSSPGTPPNAPRCSGAPPSSARPEIVLLPMPRVAASR